jgi:hypothetical protein
VEAQNGSSNSQPTNPPTSHENRLAEAKVKNQSTAPDYNSRCLMRISSNTSCARDRARASWTRMSGERIKGPRPATEQKNQTKSRGQRSVHAKNHDANKKIVHALAHSSWKINLAADRSLDQARRNEEEADTGSGET